MNLISIKWTCSKGLNTRITPLCKRKSVLQCTNSVLSYFDNKKLDVSQHTTELNFETHKQLNQLALTKSSVEFNPDNNINIKFQIINFTSETIVIQ